MARVAEGVEQRGDSFRITIKFKGQTIRETHPGNLDKAHLRRVIKRREWLLSRLRLGLPVFEEDDGLLSHLADDYFDSLSVKRSTLRSYENIWKLYWSQWGNLTPQTITTAMIKKRLSEMDVSQKTKRNAIAVLSSVLRHGEINPNPCATIRIKRDQKAPIERYRPEEVDALLEKLSDEPLVYFTIMAATGMRPGEILALQWTDWDGECLDVSKQIVRRRLEKTTKTNVRRKVFVPTWARGTINLPTRFPGGYIFQNSLGGHHCDTDVFNGAWRRAHERARVPYRIPYTLRHTRAAELLSQNCEPPRAAQQLGHSVQMFFNTYSEFIDEYSNKDTSVLEGTHREPKGNVSA